MNHADRIARSPVDLTRHAGALLTHRAAALAAAAARLPHTIQLCVHCRENPAGFWVSRTGGKTVRRPWCLSCCEQLDRDHCDVIRFPS